MGELHQNASGTFAFVGSGSLVCHYAHVQNGEAKLKVVFRELEVADALLQNKTALC